MAEGTVKWFSEKKGLVLSSRKKAGTCLFITPRSILLGSRPWLKASGSVLMLRKATGGL